MRLLIRLLLVESFYYVLTIHSTLLITAYILLYTYTIYKFMHEYVIVVSDFVIFDSVTD